jgi:hypothetical protein
MFFPSLAALATDKTREAQNSGDKTSSNVAQSQAIADAILHPFELESKVS